MAEVVMAHNRLVYVEPRQSLFGFDRDVAGYYLLIRCIPSQDGVHGISGWLRVTDALPPTDGTSVPLYESDGHRRDGWIDKGKLLDGKEAEYVPHDADPGVPEGERISIPDAARELHLSIGQVRTILANTNRTLRAYPRMQPDWHGPLPPGLLRYYLVGDHYYTTRPWLEQFKQRRALRLIQAAERDSLRERAIIARRTVRGAIDCLARRFRAEDLYLRGHYTEISPGPALHLVEQGPQEWPEEHAREALLLLIRMLDSAERD